MNKTIAIDVVLLPPDEVMERCRTINLRLLQQSGQGFRFDETHLPHVTLLQQFSNQTDLPDVFAKIERIIIRHRSLTLQVSELSSLMASGDTEVVFYAIDHSSELLELHRELFLQLKPFAQTYGDAKSFFGHESEQIRQGTIDWVASYQRDSSNENFHSHITVGVGKPPPLDQPFTFTASRLAVCHLGNFNTCRKILREWRLQSG